MRVHRRSIRGRKTSTDVDVTAFLSLMVILVPFLLITAVFSRITILELHGSAKKSAESSLDSALQLTVIVRQDVIEVSYRNQKAATRFSRNENGDYLASLTDSLVKIKERSPQNLDATILLEPQIPYDVLVQIMDAVRFRRIEETNAVRNVELFPNIALGSVAISGGRK